jgi:hypothetical protein
MGSGVDVAQREGGDAGRWQATAMAKVWARLLGKSWFGPMAVSWMGPESL